MYLEGCPIVLSDAVRNVECTISMLHNKPQVQQTTLPFQRGQVAATWRNIMNDKQFLQFLLLMAYLGVLV